MSRTASVQPLGRLLALSAVSAGIALAAGLKGVFGLPFGTAYVIAFVAAFVVLSFLSLHVSLKINFRAKGLEKAKGTAPLVARVMMVAGIFLVPFLYVTAEMSVRKPGMKLQAVIDRSEDKAGAEDRPGYKKEDRARLESLLRKEGADETP